MWSHKHMPKSHPNGRLFCWFAINYLIKRLSGHYPPHDHFCSMKWSLPSSVLLTSLVCSAIKWFWKGQCNHCYLNRSACKHYLVDKLAMEQLADQWLPSSAAQILPNGVQQHLIQLLSIMLLSNLQNTHHVMSDSSETKPKRVENGRPAIKKMSPIFYCKYHQLHQNIKNLFSFLNCCSFL